MSTRRSVLLAGLAAGSAALGAREAEPHSVVIPRDEVQRDSQTAYVLKLMQLALERSGHGYRMRQSASMMVQSRALLELAKPEPVIDVFWTMSNPARERQLLPVRIPIERGLLGWRVALVRRGDQERWKDVRTLADLAPFSAGQMHDWPDTDILRFNGLKVQTATNYRGMFGMLAAGRFDYFPRSVLEVGAEREQFKDLGLEIEPHVLFHYPAALYYFVTPSRPRLAEHLRLGLEQLQADGSFERLFQAQFGPLVNRLALNKRTVLRLQNPLLPPQTPLQRKELWWSPARK